MAKLFINKEIKTEAEALQSYYLTGEGGVSFADVRSFLDWMEPTDNHIDIELHSCGGDTTEGYAIYDALRASGREITATVVGLCGSMATVILLAAPKERRRMYPHAKLLIHSPFIPGYARDLDADTLNSLQAVLAQEKARMLAVYVERTGVESEALENQMAKASWFGPEIAKQLGFISEVLAPISAKGVDLLNPTNNKSEMKKEKQTVAQAFRALGIALGVVKDDETKGMELTTAGGDTLTVEREEGEPAVGDAASPDGEHVMPDGRTIVVTDGVITEIRDAENTEDDTDEDVEALQTRIAELEAEVKELKANAKSKEDARILAAVKAAGGEAWLSKARSNYKVDASTKAKATGSRLEAKLAEQREILKSRI